ncbi:ATP-binding protein [Mycoavidus sp. SF9855]|uniref:ATP-binding protein n=1 Tax=Mycoavidus sp. SF9855 TaxID=2968475 RepID=UPI00211C36EC|nr:ATP-binding protein [Mycoavidus sp. SF9855]UUM21779.1 putative DNA binding domain-containing protein [Mycoavidus sp. SF9855]
MDIDQLRSLITRGESETVEFKTSTAQLKAAFETLCGFLNTQGGTVLIGVKDNGEIIGQNVTDQTHQDIAREINKIEPYAEIKTYYVPLKKDQEIQLIVLVATSGANAPYFYDSRPFLRNQSTTIRMPRERYEQLLYNRKSTVLTWEKLTNNDCTIADLDEERILSTVSIAVSEQRLGHIAARASIQEILEKLNLIAHDSLTNAAVILFCKNERKQFIQSELRLARFKGIHKKEFIDNKAIRGNIFDLYEHAIIFLRNHLPVAGKVEEHSPFRIDTSAIPYQVLREALVNALCHRDYSSPGGAISLAAYDDRIEISSSGRLPADIALAELTQQHTSHPRNPIIANVLYICRMIERWGRGTQEMIDFCKAAGNPSPRFVESTGSFTVILTFKNPIHISPSIELPTPTPRQQEILKVLEALPLNSAQVVEKLANAPSRRMVQIDLAKLEEAGFIKREGDSRSLVWHVVKALREI